MCFEYSFRVEYKPLFWYRKIQNLPVIMVDPPLPTQIHRLNIVYYFEAIGSTNLISELELIITNTSTLEVTRV